MPIPALLGLWLAQAAPNLPGGGAVPFTPSVKEWSLGGAFVLKQENFLRWTPVLDPVRGWQIEPRITWLVELAPAHPRFNNFSLAVESAPATGNGGVGFLRPRVQYRVGGSQTRVGLELPMSMLVNSASLAGVRVFRPFAFVSGRF